MKRFLPFLTVLLSAALPAAAQEEHAAKGPLTVEFGLMFWTVIVFLLLLLILRKFAWPALLGAVEAREKALEEMLAEAERNRAEAAKLLAEHERLIAEAKQSAHALLVEARTAAEKERALAVEKTRQEQEDMLGRALRDIASERDRAVEELRREAVDLSLAAASKLIGQRLDSDTDRKLVQQYLTSLEVRR
jgi:F-type H+-transporting ATPase subunit b